MKFLIEISTQSTNIPVKLGGIDNPSTETLLANGWRWVDTGAVPPVADGYTRSPIRWEDSGDGVNAVAVYTDKLTSEIEAERYAERVARFQPLIPKACVFRSLMRQYFGANAETNTDVTSEVVASYFLTTTDLTVQGVQHGMTLQGLFAELSAWNGTGETWTLPWEVLP